MSAIGQFSGVARPVTPPNDAGDGCPSSTPSSTSPKEVNNDIATSFPPSPPASIRSRRDRSSSQKEASRSQRFTTRLQRSSTVTDTDPLGRKKRNFRRQTSSLPADHGLKAIEPPHEQALTKMAFAEQQKWITVQQKTFTKWYDGKLGNSWVLLTL
jgi:hypothetical protein